MRILILTIAVAALFCASQAKATIFFDESFENGTLVSSGWTTGSCQYLTPGNPNPADGCNPIRSTDVAHSGTHSLKGTYSTSCSGGWTPGANGCGEWIDHAHPNTPEVWTRFYYYTVGFTYDPIVTKHFYHEGAGTGAAFVFVNWFGNRELAGASQGETTNSFPCSGTTAGGQYNSCNYNPNIASSPLNNNQWYCVETHFKVNSQGNADGIAEVWINGTQTVGYYDRAFTGIPSYNPNNNVIRIFVQSGDGIMYYDDFAVGTTRIGCTVSQQSNVPPPAAPIGLTVR